MPRYVYGTYVPYSRRCVSATEHYPKRFPTNFLLEYMTKLQVVVMSWCLKLG